MFRKNTIKIDLCSYPPYIIMGEPKIGKTTLFRDLVLYNYGSEDKGLLVSFGDEEGYVALDKLQYEVAKEWDAVEDKDTGVRGFKQIVDEIIQSGIKIVGLDTFDKLVEVAAKEVLKLHKRETNTICKSLNDAFGGFQRGRDRMVQLILEQIGRLRSAGIAVFVLAHTKFKEKKDIISGDSYEQLTNNLRSDFYSCLSHIAQMIVNITVDRTIEEGRIIDEKRYMYFRSTALVEAGGRFKDVPEKLELGAANFMKAFEQGVKGSFLTPKTDEELEAQKEQELKELEAAAEKIASVELTLAETIKEIKKTMRDQLKDKKTTNAEIKALLGKYDLSTPDECTDITTAKAILEILKKSE